MIGGEKWGVEEGGYCWRDRAFLKESIGGSQDESRFIATRT